MIRLHPGVHKALDEVGFRSEIYNDIVRRLIKEHQERDGGGEKRRAI